MLIGSAEAAVQVVVFARRGDDQARLALGDDARWQRARGVCIRVEAFVTVDRCVVGSRGHSGLAAKLLGSVSGPLAAHAHCPVLVVHAPATASEHTTENASHHGQDTPDPGDRMVVTF